MRFALVFSFLLLYVAVIAQQISFENKKTGRIETFGLPRKVSIAFQSETNRYGIFKTRRVTLKSFSPNGDVHIITKKGIDSTINFNKLEFIRMDRTILGGCIYGFVMIESTIITCAYPFLLFSSNGTSEDKLNLEYALPYWIASLPVTYLTWRNLNRTFYSKKFSITE